MDKGVTRMNAHDMTYFTYDTPIGPLTIVCTKDYLVRIDFGHVKEDGIKKSSVISNDVANQLLSYLSGKSHVFHVPVHIEGTDFQKLVLKAIQDIPYGQTRTYSQIAQIIGHPKASRAVGTALAHNPVPIILPCHRVVPAQGGVGSYLGGSKTKKWLLDLEKHHS